MFVTRALILTPLLALNLGASSVAIAQPVDLSIPVATTSQYPQGIHVLRTQGGAVYVDARGRVLYGMDMRTLLRAGPDPAQHCVGECATIWEPLLAPPTSQPTISYPRRYGQAIASARRDGGPASDSDAPTQPPPGPLQAAPDWSVIAGAQGPQWVYKSWHMVFIRRGDQSNSIAFDGAENRTWNTLKYVPPPPTIIAPMNVKTVLFDGDYILADKSGHVLFTGVCAKDCADWQPLAAGMASAPVGEWSVSNSGDTPQWMRRGKPVFVSQDDDPLRIPATGKSLRP